MQNYKGIKQVSGYQDMGVKWEACEQRSTREIWGVTELFYRGGYTTEYIYQNNEIGTSLVAQWLRIRLPMQGTWVRALVQEDPTCHGATKHARHNYGACALETVSHNYWSPRT